MIPVDYRTYLKSSLNTLEKFHDLFHGTDERLDYTNYLLTQLLSVLGGSTLPDESSPNGTSPNGSPVQYMAIPNRPGFRTGSKTVTTAGTAVQLSSSPIAIPDGFQLVIIAHPDNSGTIYIAPAKVEAEGFQRFDGLEAGLATSLKITDVSLVWINGDTDGDGVSWHVEL